MEKSTLQFKAILKFADKRKEVRNSWTQVASMKEETDEGFRRNNRAEVLDDGNYVAMWEDIACVGPGIYGFQKLLEECFPEILQFQAHKVAFRNPQTSPTHLYRCFVICRL